jgi:hypothetical protein
MHGERITEAEGEGPVKGSPRRFVEPYQHGDFQLVRMHAPSNVVQSKLPPLAPRRWYCPGHVRPAQGGGATHQAHAAEAAGVCPLHRRWMCA